MDKAHLGKGVGYQRNSFAILRNVITRLGMTDSKKSDYDIRSTVVTRHDRQRRAHTWAGLFLLIVASLFFSMRAYALEIAIQTPSNPIKTTGTNESVYITVGNPGTTLAKNVTLVLVTPNGATINPLDIDPGAPDHTVTCSGGCGIGKVLSIDLKTLAAGETVRVSLNNLTVPFINALNPTPITLDISARVDGQETTTAKTVLEFDPTPDIQVSLDASSGPVNPGDKVTYTVTYSQRDSAPLQSSKVQLRLPSGVTYLSSTNSPSVTGALIEWDTGTFESKAIGVQQVTVQIDSAGLVNGNLLTAEANFSGQDSGLDDVKATVNRTVYIDDGPRPHVAFNLQAQQSGRLESARTRITVSNPTSEAMTNVELYIRYPGGVSAPVLFTDTGGRVNKITCTSGACASGTLATYELKRIAPGAATTIDYMPLNAFSAYTNGDLIPLDATVRVNGVQRASASDSFAVTPKKYFSSLVEVASGPVTTNSDVTYEIDYQNATDLDYTSTRLVFPVPEGTTFVDASGGPTQVTGLNGLELHWDLGTLNSYEVGHQSVKLNIPAGVFNNGDLLDVETHISGQDPGFELRELRAKNITVISNRTRPDVSFRFAEQNVGAKGPVTLAMTVSNPTDQAMKDISVVMRNPDNLSLLGIGGFDTGGDANTTTCSSGVCNRARLFTMDLNALQPGTGVTYNVSYRNTSLNPGATTVLPFHANVRVGGLQKTFVSDNVRVGDDPFYTINIDTPSEPIQTNVQLQYTIKYGNVSALPSNNTIIRFPIPEGMDFVSANSGGVFDGTAIEWTPGTVTGGETYAVEAVLQANGGEVKDGNILSEVVTISGTDSGLNNQTISQRWHNRVNGAIKPSLEIVPADDPAIPGRATQLDINVTNPSSSILRNVSLFMRYPENLDSVRVADIDTGGTANVVTCASNSCSSGNMMSVDLATIPAGRTVRIRIPIRRVASNLADGTLIPVSANVRVNGIQKVLASSTIRVDRAPTPVVGGGAIELKLNTADRTQYGWKYGTSNHGQSVPFKFQSIGEDLLLTLRGYDIDDADEVSVLLNGAEVGNLIVSRNNATSGFNRIVLPIARQQSGTNFLEFKQKKPGFKYGITTIKIRPVAGPAIPLVLGTKDQTPYGYRYKGTSTHPGIIPMTFTGGSQDLFLSLVGYDIDDSDEVSVWLNGSQLGAVKKGRNNQTAPVTRIFVPLSQQVSGTNRLEFKQLKVGNIYGIKNVFLRAALGPVVPLTAGVKDSTSYGYRFFKSSQHATRLQATFGRINDDVKISLRAYDIDTADEVSVYLNGALLGNLSASGNLLEKTTVFEVDEASIQDNNVLEFRQLVPGNRWGIRNLFVRPAQ